MNYQAYQKAYFVEPQPEQKFKYKGILGVTLFFEAYETAVAYYTAVLGSPAYVEKDDTKGWQLGNTWLTLLKGGSGYPQNVEVSIITQTVSEAEKLQAAFIAAGGKGPAPSDQLMYQPVRSCPVSDPFGTQILIYALL